MKYLFLALLALSLISCATTREPSSVNPEDVTQGLNADYYGTR
jgi:hypothetical protein